MKDNNGFDKRVCIAITSEDRARLKKISNINRLSPSSFARQAILLMMDEFEKSIKNKEMEEGVNGM